MENPPNGAGQAEQKPHHTTLHIGADLKPQDIVAAKEIPASEYKVAVDFCMRQAKNRALVVVQDPEVQKQLAESYVAENKEKNGVAGNVNDLDVNMIDEDVSFLVATDYSSDNLDTGRESTESTVQGRVRGFVQRQAMYGREANVLVLTNSRPNPDFRYFHNAPWLNGPFNDKSYWEVKPSQEGKLEVFRLHNVDTDSKAKPYTAWEAEKVDYLPKQP